MLEKIKIDFDKYLEIKNFSKDETILRRKSFDQFLSIGLPNKKIEDWKFSDLNKVLNDNFEEISIYKEENILNVINNKIIKEFEHNSLIIFNGKLFSSNFEYENTSKIKLNQLSLSEKNLKRENSLTSLNSALIEKIVELNIGENYEFKKPLIIYHLSDNNLSDKIINNKIKLNLGQNSKLICIEIFGYNKNKNFNLKNLEITLDKNSILKKYKYDDINNEQINYSYENVNLEENSNFENFIFSVGSKFSKNEILCNLNGKHSSCFLNGIINLDDQKHHEIKTFINHANENTKSHQLVKSVLSGSSTGVFQGKIYVNKIAQKTDGYQLSKALLLSENSEFDAKPELEIYADDVKCSHGSTSGNIDEQSMFYLMSRGLSHHEAKKMLINGFLIDVVEQITEEKIKELTRNYLIK